MKDACLNAAVEEGTVHYVLARRSKRGRTVIIDCLDLRLKPRDMLTQETLSCSLEKELGEEDPAQSNKNYSSSDDITSDCCVLRTCTKESSCLQRHTGKYADIANDKRSITGTLTSDNNRIMKHIQSEIGRENVPKRKPSSAPPRRIDKAFHKEYRCN